MPQFPLRDLLVHVVQALLRPVLWPVTMRGTNGPGPVRENFQSICLITLENHFLSVWMPSWQDVNLGYPKGSLLENKPTQMNQSREVASLCCWLRIHIHPAMNPLDFSVTRAREFSFCLNQFELVSVTCNWNGLTHYQVKGEVTTAYNTKYFFLKHQVS